MDLAMIQWASWRAGSIGNWTCPGWEQGGTQKWRAEELSLILAASPSFLGASVRPSGRCC